MPVLINCIPGEGEPGESATDCFSCSFTRNANGKYTVTGVTSLTEEEVTALLEDHKLIELICDEANGVQGLIPDDVIQGRLQSCDNATGLLLDTPDGAIVLRKGDFPQPVYGNRTFGAAGQQSFMLDNLGIVAGPFNGGPIVSEVITNPNQCYSVDVIFNPRAGFQIVGGVGPPLTITTRLLFDPGTGVLGIVSTGSPLQFSNQSSTNPDTSQGDTLGLSIPGTFRTTIPAGGSITVRSQAAWAISAGSLAAARDNDVDVRVDTQSGFSWFGIPR